jgi:hypothetical protein
MRSLERLTTVLIVSSGFLVAASYFLPYEDRHWSPFLMAQGYVAGGGFLDGPIVAGFESAPAACGLLLATVLFLRGKPRLASLALGGFLALWVSLAVLYALDFFSLPSLRFPAIYAITGFLTLAGTAWICWLVIRRHSQAAPILLGTFLAACLVLSEAVAIAFVLLEDGLLLNYGAVTSSVGAAVLAVSYLFRHELHRNGQCPPAGARSPVESLASP